MFGFGEKLRELRLQHKLTIENAAKIVGVAKSTYSGYESEFRQPSLEKLVQFANYYHVSVDYLLNVTPSREINVEDFLSNKELHWEGIRLYEEDLKQIKNFLDQIVEQSPKKHKGNKLG
ncbi:helix-turn-helix transcriptional regulator [Neobacillus sp. PS3-34]|uniref:helix-turn-helix domain-containing protein n=1 Tax=Neobacillus sp. PS3-34 TaxID=3070678 RepID=UPI0027E09254|nr:helix-turn-helix transcriptional regulator [Neobacillus sp. PS3-34]WML49539.1 helix-turn-helix transcriptional regulator [Neobacillus sp. PS3-34]